VGDAFLREDFDFSSYMIKITQKTDFFSFGKATFFGSAFLVLVYICLEFLDKEMRDIIYPLIPIFLLLVFHVIYLKLQEIHKILCFEIEIPYEANLLPY